MPNPGLPDEELIRSVRALEEAGNMRAAAFALGISRPTLENRIRRAAIKGLMGTKPVLPGFGISSTSTQFGPSGEVQKEWIRQKPEPGEEFEVPAGHAVKGVSALVGADGRIVQQWVKTKQGGLDTAAICEQVKAALADMEARAEPVPAPASTEDDLATVYLAADWHVGLLAWQSEVGHNYDIKIAKRTIETAMARLIDGAPRSKQAVVLGLGDLLHSDSYENTTSRSKNQLDVDGRWPMLLQTATRLVRFTVDEALRKHERVLVRILPGNHDDQSAIAVTLALSMYYERDERVTVDDDAGPFWWWSWGKVLLGAAHGDQAKMKDLPLVMATARPEEWGRSQYRHIYTGHIHTQTGIEVNGVTVESFQTPVPTDAWHHRRGYSSTRSVTAVTHHRIEGEISRHKVNIV